MSYFSSAISYNTVGNLFACIHTFYVDSVKIMKLSYSKLCRYLRAIYCVIQILKWVIFLNKYVGVTICNLILCYDY